MKGHLFMKLFLNSAFIIFKLSSILIKISFENSGLLFVNLEKRFIMAFINAIFVLIGVYTL